MYVIRKSITENRTIIEHGTSREIQKCLWGTGICLLEDARKSLPSLIEKFLFRKSTIP